MLRPLFLAAFVLLIAMIGPASAQTGPLPGVPGVQTGSEPAETAPPERSQALTDLIEVLKDPESREALIAELEDTGAVPPASEETVQHTTLGAGIAVATRDVVDRVSEAFARIPIAFRSAQRLLQGLDRRTWEAIGSAARNLAVFLAVTLGVFYLLRRLASRVIGRLGARAQGANLARAAAIIAGSVVIRFLTVIATLAIAFFAMSFILGGFGEIGTNGVLFLNAFFFVELSKAAVRTLFSPSAPELRALPMGDEAARRVSRVASMVMSILGYGLLLIVPIVQNASGLFAARSVSVLVVEIALVYLAIVVVWYRRPVGEWLVQQLLAPPPKIGSADADAASDGPASEGATAADDQTKPEAQGFLASLLRRWHWFALAWLGYVLLRSFTSSLDALADIVLGTLQVGAAAFAGSALMAIIGRRVELGVILSQDVRERFPALEGRLNAVIPHALVVLRALIAIAVAFFALDRMGLTTFGSWLSTEGGQVFISNATSVIIILLVAWGLWLVMASWVDYRLSPDNGRSPSSREITLLTLLKNAITVAILLFATMFALSEMGLNIGPLLASAGVLGLAIGFGAQKLVQDIITGIFIQFENAINVGDVVTVGGVTATVERLTVRSVTLRDLHGVVHIVPFSSVDMVANYTREFSYYVIDMGIAYREDVDEAEDAMFEAFQRLRSDPDQGTFVLGDLEYFGVNAFGDNAVVLRARLKTWPGKQWGVGRAYNRYLKLVFDERGIEIPFPHRTLYFGEAKDGSIQTLPIRQAPQEG